MEGEGGGDVGDQGAANSCYEALDKVDKPDENIGRDQRCGCPGEGHGFDGLYTSLVVGVDSVVSICGAEMVCIFF